MDGGNAVRTSPGAACLAGPGPFPSALTCYDAPAVVGERVQKAREVRAALGAFFERALVPSIVVDDEGRFVAANDAAVKIGRAHV